MTSGTPAPAPAQDAPPTESQVKAAFLVNFPKYVTWPAEVFAQSNSPITIAVLGDDAVASVVAEMIKDKAVDGHPLVLKRAAGPEEIGADCLIVFVAAASRESAPAVLRKLRKTSVLTVGESDGFFDHGGIINLTHRGKKIRLEVSLTAARVARLKISSQLLSVADVVKGKPN